MVQRQNQGHEGSTLNSYYDDRSGYQMKVSALNDSSIAASAPDGDKKNGLVDIKYDASFPNLTSQIRILIVESEPDIRLLFKT
jgi:hypothetical protein